MTTPAVAWLFGRQSFGVKPGLERVRGLLADLGNPQASFRTILVGGTNGKGTTATALATCLQADLARRTGTRSLQDTSAGSEPGRIGLFTSPHLEHVTERFAIDGVPVEPAELDRALRAVRPHAEMRDATFFEIATVAAAHMFAAAGVQTAVFEVGLGGTWDATNALEPTHSVITGVARDHTDILGTELSGIALDKAGILRSGVPAVTGAVGIAAETITAEAARVGAPLWRLGAEIAVRGRHLGWDGQELWIDTPAGSVHTTTTLLGEHQRRNLALSAAVALRDGVDRAVVEGAIPAVRWPGRLERFEREGRRVVLDGAHNPAAAHALVSALRSLDAVPYTLVLGVGADKDVPGMCRALASEASWVFATRAVRSPRALAPDDLASVIAPLARMGGVCDDPQDALELAMARTPVGGTVLVAGSLYLVGEVRSLLSGRAQEPWARWQ